MKRPRRPPRTLPTSLASTNHKWGTFLPSQTSHKTEMRPCHRPSRRIRRIPWPVTRTPRLMLRRLSKQVLLPWMGFFLSPRLLKSLMRTTYDAQDISHVGPAACRCGPVSRPGHAAVSSSQALPDVHRPWHSSKGSYSSTRSSQTAPGQLLCSSPAPWSWPRRGSDVPAFLSPLVLPVLLPPDAGAPAPSLQSSVAFPPGPPTPQLMPGPAVKNPLSYSPVLGSIFPAARSRNAGCSAASTSLLPPPGLPCWQQVPKTPVSAASSPVLPPHLPRWLSRPPRL